MSFLGCRHSPPPRSISPITRYRTNVHLHLTMNLTLNSVSNLPPMTYDLQPQSTKCNIP